MAKKAFNKENEQDAIYHMSDDAVFVQSLNSSDMVSMSGDLGEILIVTSVRCAFCLFINFKIVSLSLFIIIALTWKVRV